MPPLTCPPPEPDCALHAYHRPNADERLRRAVLMEKRPPGLADLIQAEAKAARRPIAALPPASEPESLPILEYLNQKGATK